MPASDVLPKLKDSYDVIVLGAGAGGMAAAAVAASEGLEALLLEKTGYVGGTTAYSGGMVWAPNNPQQDKVGSTDTFEAARTYLAATAGQGAGADLRRVFLERAPEAVAYLDRRTEVKLTALEFYPDYYPEAPGATSCGRTMEPFPFDARELGKDFELLRPPLPEFTLFKGMMIARPDIVHFRNVSRSPRSLVRVLRLVLAYARDRLRYHRGTKLVLGNALAARLLRSLQVLDVEVRCNASVRRLISGEGRIEGVEIEGSDGPVVVKARRGVVLATGGFSHNQEFRRRYLPAEASAYSATAEGATGDGLELASEAGGYVPGDDGNDAFWAPLSSFDRADGSIGIYPHTVTDRGKPGMLAVNREGRRFTNEANSYHDFVKGMFAVQGNRPSVPAYLICDRQALQKYGLGAVKPKRVGLPSLLASGYVTEAPGITELATKIAIDADNLRETVEIYNRDSRAGIDTQFGRGSNAYHRYTGDPENQPNPCMRPLEAPPFYAVEMRPGDLGTAAGLRTSADGEVLFRDGRPVSGLYACGNDMNSIMAGSYPGPGITLGPALVFGYLVGMHLAHGARSTTSDGELT